MWTTSYSAARAGTPVDAPWYGYTFSGEPMRNGIVAADLDILPLGTRVFVEGYGEGEVLDTGGGLTPRHIDLGYADEGLPQLGPVVGRVPAVAAATG